MDSDTDGAPHKTDSDGNPNVFNVEHNDDGLWLNNNWAKPDNEWNPDNKFVFRLRNYFFSATCCNVTGCGFSFQGLLSFSSSHQTFYQPLQVLRQHPGNASS